MRKFLYNTLYVLILIILIKACMFSNAKSNEICSGENYQLIKYVKDNMNLPDSFIHIETKYKPYTNNNYIIKMEYFGSYFSNGNKTKNILVQKSIIGLIDNKCNLIGIKVIDE